MVLRGKGRERRKRKVDATAKLGKSGKFGKFDRFGKSRKPRKSRKQARQAVGSVVAESGPPERRGAVAGSSPALARVLGKLGKAKPPEGAGTGVASAKRPEKARGPAARGRQGAGAKKGPRLEGSGQIQEQGEGHATDGAIVPLVGQGARKVGRRGGKFPSDGLIVAGRAEGSGAVPGRAAGARPLEAATPRRAEGPGLPVPIASFMI